MQAVRIDESTIRKQLSTKRDLLFQQFLQNPVDIQLIGKIRRIDARIAKLTTDFRAEHKPEHD